MMPTLPGYRCDRHAVTPAQVTLFLSKVAYILEL